MAVGGYGRSQLFPYSDIDVLLLVPPDNAALRPALEAFVTACWDTGLEIGSSVRTVSECLEESRRDITVQTSLLEAHLVCGNAALFADFQQQFRAHLDVAAF